jgi:diguanylate cyclase (GGDEF)-like protein
LEPAVLTRATEKPDPGSGSGRKDPRLRAAYRRELQNNVFASALAVAAGIAGPAAAACLLDPGAGIRYALVAIPLALAELWIARSVRKRRRRVVQLGLLAGILPVLSVAICLPMVPAFRPVTLASIAVMPLAFAIFVQLDRSYHALWLAVFNVVFACMAGLSWLDAADLSVSGAIVFAGVLGTATSLLANEVQLRRRGQMDGQLLAVRGLYARMKEHELDLRRQDEFLFMQQETLVVQQAELLRLNEELERIARLDALTGLGNRLRLNEDLAQLAGRIERNGGSAGLLLMDLDRFKRLNDLSGHLAGDAALRGVADVLRKTSRVGDGLYRYGGEEFLVVLHDCDETVLRSVAKRYITAIEAAGMSHPDNPPYQVVTASAGAVELSSANCTDIDAALHDADEALYVAKARGRNRLEVHGQSQKGGILQIEKQRAAS